MKLSSANLHIIVRTCRELREVTRDEAADKIGRTSRQLADYEVGKAPIPIDVIVNMAIAYEAPKLVDVVYKNIKDRLKNKNYVMN